MIVIHQISLKEDIDNPFIFKYGVNALMRPIARTSKIINLNANHLFDW